ncbi:MAG TPA: hypothetical protein VN902_07130 [Candidatus Acidoferrales bacterium]|nr:hypothetical protein [Candidatus Acidoferrales bacterium]
MPLSSAKRAWIVIAVALLCLVGAGLAYYFWQSHPLPPIVSSVSGVPTAGPPPDILSQLPADAPVIAYVDAANLRALQNSPLAAALGLAAPGPQADRDYANFVRDTGFDYTRDLDHAAVAFWPSNFGTSPKEINANRALVIADGRFDQQKISTASARNGTATTASDVSSAVWVIPGNPTISYEFLAPTRMALASGDSDVLVRKLADIDRKRYGTRDPAMQSRIQRVAGAPLFAVARTDRLPQSIYAPLHSSPQLEQIARSVQAITLAGQPDRNNLKITIDAECDALKNAVQLAFLLETGKMAGSMALSDPRTRSQMTKEQFTFVEALINRATINHQNKIVRITLEITPDMLAAAPVPPKAAASHAPTSPHAAAPAKPGADYPHTSP